MSAEGKLSPAEYLRRVGMGVANALGQTPPDLEKIPSHLVKGTASPPQLLQPTNLLTD